MSKATKEIAQKNEQAKKTLTTFYELDEKEIDALIDVDEEKTKKKKKKKLIKRVEKLEKEMKKLKKKLK